MVAGVTSLLAGIVLLPFILDEVGAGSYGVWLVLSSVAAYLYYSDVGVGAAITHFGARKRGGQDGPSLPSLLATGFMFSAAACLIVAPIYFAFSLWYVRSWGSSVAAEEQVPLVLLSLGLLLPLLLRPFGSALVGAGFLTVDRRNQVIGVVVRVCGTLVACACNAGILGIAFVELLALLIPSILTIISLSVRGLGKFSIKNVSTATLKLMLKFSYRSFSVSLVGALTLQSGMIIIGLVGSSADVAYYNAAFRIYSSVRQLLAWTVDPFRSALSRLFAKNRADAGPVLMSILFVSLGAGAAASCGLIIAIPDLVPLWLGGSVPVSLVSVTAQVLLGGLLLNMIHIPLAPATDAAGKPGTLLWGQIIWLCLCVGLSFPLASRYGILGIGLALSLPLIVVEPLMLVMAMRALDIRISEWIRSVASPVAVLIGVSLLPTAIVGVLLYRLDLGYSWLLLTLCYGVCFLITIAIFDRTFGLRKLFRVLNVDL